MSSSELLDAYREGGDDSSVSEVQAADKLRKSMELPIFSTEGFALIQRMAQMYSKSKIVPDTFRGDVASCTIALNIARRLNADELMVMQNLYIVYGRPAWSAKFLIATFNKCGRFEPIRYKFQGDEGSDEWGCRAISKNLSTGDEIVGPLITIQLSKDEGWYSKKGSKWKTMPEKMLRYRAAAWMVDTTAPEISMGLMTDDEARDAGDLRESAPSASDLNDVLKKRDTSVNASYESVCSWIDEATTPQAVNQIRLDYAGVEGIDDDALNAYAESRLDVIEFSEAKESEESKSGELFKTGNPDAAAN